MTRFVYFAVVIGLFYSFIVALLNLMPAAAPLPEALAQAVLLIFGYMLLFNFFFPIDQLFIVLGLSLTLQGAILAWAATRWVVGIISNFMSS